MESEIRLLHAAFGERANASAKRGGLRKTSLTLPQERGYIRVEYETYVPPLSGGAVETGLMTGSDGMAAIGGTDRQAGASKPSAATSISVCGTKNSST